MSRVSANSERIISASPATVYGVLTDYRSKRPLMLTPNFLEYTVEQGGQGNGTVVSYRLQAAGRERPYRMHVKESTPGRVITEHDNASSLVTTWTLTPLDQGQRTKVRVQTEWEGSSGVGGFFERTFAPLGLQRIYTRMLDLLTYLVPSQNKGSVALEDSKNTAANASAFFLTFGIVMAFAFLMSIWQKNKNQQV